MMNTHTHLDKRTDTIDPLDMSFVSLDLATHDIQFQIDDDLGTEHLPIEVSIDAPSRENSSINHTRYKFDQTGRIDRYTDFVITAVESMRPLRNTEASVLRVTPFQMKLALIKERRRLRRQYSQTEELAVKTCINQLQKQIKYDIMIETQASWEKVCNSISSETSQNES